MKDAQYNRQGKNQDSNRQPHHQETNLIKQNRIKGWGSGRAGSKKIIKGEAKRMRTHMARGRKKHKPKPTKDEHKEGFIANNSDTYKQTHTDEQTIK